MGAAYALFIYAISMLSFILPPACPSKSFALISVSKNGDDAPLTSFAVPDDKSYILPPVKT